MKLDYSKIKVIVNDLNAKIKNNHISNVTVVNSHDIIFSFSMFRKQRLLLSLNHENPFVSLINSKDSITTTTGQLNDYLRKDVRDGFVKNISAENEDKVIKIEIEKSNDYFEKETRYLFIELIAHRPNLIIVNADNSIDYVLHQTSLDAERTLLKGALYELPKKSANFKTANDEFDLNIYYEECENYLSESKEKKLVERYSKLFKYIKIKTKSLKNKIKVLVQEIEAAKKDLIFGEYANCILSLQNEYEELIKYVEENKIPYDTSLSTGINADKLFKKFKKAKRTIQLDEIEIDKANVEIEKYEVINSQIPYFSDDDLLELSKELMPKYSPKNVSKYTAKISYIEVDDVRIYFGKTASQNDELTFKLSNKNHYYFHIKDYHCSHVVVASDNPTNKQIQTACEMCLILSNKTAGDIIYTQIKFLKKGNEKGQTLMPSYHLVTLNKISESTQVLLRNFHR